MDHESMPVRIEEKAAGDAPMELLLEADPSGEKIRAYLGEGRCFVATVNGETAGVYVLKPIGPLVYELMNISVAVTHQRKGLGTLLVKHAIASVREWGGRRLEVGTASFGFYLTFYQREGFRVSSIVRDFFLQNYPEPIYEGGIQHKDMLRLTLELD